MKTNIATLLVFSLLLAACSRQPTNSDGNGPGNADGVGGREDPVTAPDTNGAVGDESGSASETRNDSTAPQQ